MPPAGAGPFCEARFDRGKSAHAARLAGAIRAAAGALHRQEQPVCDHAAHTAARAVAGHPRARTQIGRALAELDIEWIAAHSPQAKGRIERLFGTLQDRLVKEMRLAGIDTLEGANRFLEITFWPFWEKRFTVRAAQGRDAHRRLEREHRLEQILSVRVERDGGLRSHGGLERPAMGPAARRSLRGLRGARAEIEKRLDGTHWLRFRGHYCRCALVRKRCDPQVLPAYGLQNLRIANQNPQPKSKPTTARLPIILGVNHGSGHFYVAQNRTFLLCVDRARTP